MARMTIKIALDLDLRDYRAEYGESTLTLDEIRNLIASDILDALRAGPYSSALREVAAK
ncbi:hypothetical protein ABTZ98_32210 [Streptomyces bacillaris]|uniref:hypothetical protein n=1 Tax=unclassified Micromonospora TaxID=2617518 RepID=UPI0033536C84